MKLKKYYFVRLFLENNKSSKMFFCIGFEVVWGLIFVNIFISKKVLNYLKKFNFVKMIILNLLEIYCKNVIFGILFKNSRLLIFNFLGM